MAVPTSENGQRHKEEHKAEARTPGITSPEPGTPEGSRLSGARLDREWLETKSKTELIDIITGLNTASLARTGRVEVEFSPPTPRTDAKVDRFVRVPAAPSQNVLAQTSAIWRVMLVSSNPSHEPLRLEIAGDVLVGRSADDADPDLDLTQYDAMEKGISRRHAMLYPTSSALVVMDLRSTNGTYLNSTRFDAGTAQSLKDGDTISFGQLHFKVHFADQRVSPAE